jgi:hypothetical protein
MIELRWLHLSGIDKPVLQYRNIMHGTSTSGVIGLPTCTVGEWQDVPHVLAYHDLQESEHNE